MKNQADIGLGKMRKTKRRDLFNFLAMLIFSAVLTVTVFAHGGEDHGDAKPTVAANQKGVVMQTAQSGDFEVLFKHALIEPDTATAAKLFVTRFATNEPFADAKITVELTAKDGKTFAVSEVKTDSPGSFGFEIPPLPAGDYTVSAKLNAAGKNDTATFSGVKVEYSEAESQTDSGSRMRTALMISTAFILLGLFGGLLFYAFRFTDGAQVSEESAAV